MKKRLALFLLIGSMILCTGCTRPVDGAYTGIQFRKSIMVVLDGENLTIRTEEPAFVAAPYTLMDGRLSVQMGEDSVMTGTVENDTLRLEGLEYPLTRQEDGSYFFEEPGLLSIRVKMENGLMDCVTGSAIPCTLTTDGDATVFSALEGEAVSMRFENGTVTTTSGGETREGTYTLTENALSMSDESGTFLYQWDENSISISIDETPVVTLYREKPEA